MLMQRKPLYEFGPYRLDAEERVLLRHGDPVPLPPKDLETLFVLVERSGHIVGKEELLERVWPGVFVEEGNLAKHVFNLRQLLTAGTDGREFIETVPKRGYRFIALVREVSADASAQPTSVILPAGRPRRRRMLAAGLLVVVLAVYGVHTWRQSRAVPPPARVMLAVLPFQNLTGNPELEYFSDGLTEEMIGQLGRLNPKQLGVIARTSSMTYKTQAKPVREVGHELGVDYVLEGSVRKDGDRLRITAQLIRVSDETHVWVENYEEAAGHSLTVQQQAALAVAEAIQITLSAQQRERLTQPRPLHPQAHAFYLKGRYHWNLRTVDGYRQAVKLFQQAIAGQPDYALAYAGLADSYLLQSMTPGAGVRREVARDQALAALDRALQLDSALAEAHASRGLAYAEYFWDLEGAAREFERSLAVNPDYATAHHWYAYNLMIRGQVERSLEEIQIAKRLDPLSPAINSTHSELLYYARRYDDVLVQVQRSLELEPDYPWLYLYLGWAYQQKGMFPEALQAHQRAVQLSGNRPDMVGYYGHCLALAGERTQAEEILRELANRSRREGNLAHIAAFISVALGRKHEALTWLEEAYQQRINSLLLIRVLPLYDPLRSDPRFHDLVRRVFQQHGSVPRPGAS